MAMQTLGYESNLSETTSFSTQLDLDSPNDCLCDVLDHGSKVKSPVEALWKAAGKLVFSECDVLTGQAARKSLDPFLGDWREGP